MRRTFTRYWRDEDSQIAYTGKINIDTDKIEDVASFPYDVYNHLTDKELNWITLNYGYTFIAECSFDEIVKLMEGKESDNSINPDIIFTKNTQN